MDQRRIGHELQFRMARNVFEHTELIGGPIRCKIVVTDILRGLIELLDSIGADNADTGRRELDGPAAILESHFH